MTSITGFLSAVVLLLAAPGPTNTLLFMSGAGSGIRRSLSLLVAESAGYLTVVLSIAVFAAPFLESRPELLNAMKLVAAGWIVFMASKLWRRAAVRSDGAVVSLRTMFMTTLLNPKAAIVGLVIMPHGPVSVILPWVAAFLLCLGGIAIIWIAAGTLAGRGANPDRRLRLMCRIAAICLVAFAALILHGALTSLTFAF